jgi:hypothetical protein
MQPKSHLVSAAAHLSYTDQTLLNLTTKSEPNAFIIIFLPLCVLSASHIVRPLFDSREIKLHMNVLEVAFGAVCPSVPTRLRPLAAMCNMGSCTADIRTCGKALSFFVSSPRLAFERCVVHISSSEVRPRKCQYLLSYHRSSCHCDVKLSTIQLSTESRILTRTVWIASPLGADDSGVSIVPY